MQTYSIKIILLFIAFLFPHFLRAQLNVNLKKGLIAYYNFSGNAEDQSLYKNHGQLRGSPSFTKDRFGNDCSALQLNGKDSYVSVKSSQSLKSPQQAISVAAWFKIDKNSPFADLQWVSICCKSDQAIETDQSPQYRFQSTRVTMSINTDFTEDFKYSLNFDQWYFYTLTYDQKKVRVYLDTRLIWEFDYCKALIPNDLPLDIGRDVPGAEEFFAGVLDDLHIYNRKLSEVEIEELFQDKSEKNPSTNPCGISSTVMDEAPLEPKPKSPGMDNIQIQEEIEVSSQRITVYLYDHEEEDGDIISLNFDGEWVLEKHKLKNRKSRLKNNQHIELRLEPNRDYYLISRAWNLGKIPPNTLTLEIYDGIHKKPQISTINSSIGRSGAIRIRYNK